jgi:diguanylate cyclase (GGDEF)-like protein
LEKDVFRDVLTELGNRKLLEIKINSAIQEYHQHQISFGLLFIDIDHFKAINDTYGHQEGDRVLQNVAKSLTGHLRNTDMCGRWGGEEFIAILYDVNLKSLALIAEKLHAMIANSTITVNKQNISVTASIGGVVVHETDTTDSIIERADKYMYQSKQNGRNQVTLES